MPYTENAGVRIYYEVEGSGPALVLQHGFMSSLQDWTVCGYVPALRPSYQVILVDALGHGGSDKPHDETSYTLERRVSDITSVLDAIGVEKAHVWGYSMGGYIGFGMAQYAPDRLGSLVVGGAHPYARDQSAHRQILREGIAGGGDTFVAAFTKFMEPIPDAYAATLRAADLRAWLAAAGDRVDVEHVLGAKNLRCCIYCGEADLLFVQAKLAAEQIPKACFIALPGLSHVQAFMQSGSVLPQVQAFLGAP
jgi:pimeloyl-ACP methyl ester carboxylesterase